MNKAKKQDKTLLMLCIGVVFMLIVTAVMSFAYFTARAQSETQTIQFGVLELDPINDFSLTSKESHTPIVPGCTINMAGTIKLTTASNVDAFVRLKPTVTVTKNGKPVTNVSADTFVTLFNEALSKDNGKWKTPTTADGYLYFVGKFSKGATNARIVESFNFTGSSFTIDPTTFGNEWQGVTVSIGLTVQALQSAHVGVDDVTDKTYPQAQDLVNAIANIGAWKTEFKEDVKLNAIYTGKYATNYVRGTLNNTAYKAGAKVANQMTKSPFNYFEENSTGDYVAFGFYPQTLKDDNVNIDESNKETFNEVDYYLGSDGYLYEKADSSFYFKVEPIIWQIMKDNDTVGSPAYLISVAELTAQAFDASNNRSNIYENSTIRTFLEGEFSSKAFTQAQRDAIQATTLTTSGYSNDTDPPTDKTVYNVGETGATTYKVFLPSYGDMKSYGYKTEATDANRIKYPTVYASFKGVDMSSNVDEGGYYWSRSPDAYSTATTNSAWYVNSVGGMFIANVINNGHGVVPALFLNI